jgi:hypothetical protein
MHTFIYSEEDQAFYIGLWDKSWEHDGARNSIVTTSDTEDEPDQR